MTALPSVTGSPSGTGEASALVPRPGLFHAEMVGLPVDTKKPRPLGAPGPNIEETTRGELARLASTQEARETFLSLQMTWIRLAMELQQAGALIKAVQELEEQPVKAAE